MPPNKIILWLIAVVVFLSACSSKLLNLADEKLQAGDYGAAAALYEQYLAKGPLYTLIPSRKLGYALLQSANAAGAVTRFEKILDEFPADPFSTLYLGLSYLQLGNRDQVLSVWENYHAAKSSLIAVEIQRQAKRIADSGPVLSAETIEQVNLAVAAAISAEGARRAYNSWRLDDCG